MEQRAQSDRLAPRVLMVVRAEMAVRALTAYKGMESGTMSSLTPQQLSHFRAFVVRYRLGEEIRTASVADDEALQLGPARRDGCPGVRLYSP